MPNASDMQLSEAVERISKLDVPTVQKVSERAAAVLVLLYQDATGIRVVLTLRSPKLRSHAGEVCLPGGKADKEDVDNIATALREANEEIGLLPEKVQIVHSPLASQPVLSKHYLSVTPIVGFITEETRQQLKSNEEEVECVFDAPLEMFLHHSSHHSHRDVSWTPSICYRLHYFTHEYQRRTFKIWGLTAGILIEVAKMIYDMLPDYDDCIPNSPPYSEICYDGQSVVLRSSSE